MQKIIGECFFGSFLGLVRYSADSVNEVQALRETVARLRGTGGCPWDREQTHQSLTRCLVEECAELLDTIDRLDYSHMREELGDVLLQVVFHAQIREEEGDFSLEDVARDINSKLVRRHPHVFGDKRLNTSAEVLVEWEKIKATEKKNGAQHVGLFKNLPPQLPALLHAYDVYKQIRKEDMDCAGLVDASEIKSLADGLDEETAGSLIFSLAAACRDAGIDPEAALRRYTQHLMEAIEDAHCSKQ